MSYIVAASAVGTLMSYGYTEAEAKRIRGFLPRRFQLFSQPLPPTNVEAWLAYRAVKHYLLCTAERGRFRFAQPSGYFSLQSTEMMEYVTEKEIITFSSIEFVRHFGEALFTDMDNNLGHRLARLNVDGSFVIKNRCLDQACNEMEQRAVAPNGPGVSVNPYYGMVQNALYLPRDETYSPRDIFTMYMHGNAAKEYLNQNNVLIIPYGTDYHQVAKYLYFLYCENLKGEEHGKQAESERMTVKLNLSRRAVTGHGIDFPHKRYGHLYFEDMTVLTETMITHASPIPPHQLSLPFGYVTSRGMARIVLHNQIQAAPVIPMSVKKYFSTEEWRNALTTLS